MLNLDTHITINESVTNSPNLAERFGEVDRTRIATLIWDGYERDKYSRTKWEKRNEAAMDLAMQNVQEKNFPWPGCANVAFPLVTIATLQFHSRAYPAILQGTDVVKYRVLGDDPEGQEVERSRRVGTYMSYQLLEEDTAWEEQHDRLLINIPIVGCAFKKSYFNPATGTNTSELVMARDFVLDYYAKSVETCARKTHRFTLSRNDIYSGVRNGIYLDVLDEEWFRAPAARVDRYQQFRRDNRTGLTPAQTDMDTPFTGLEQHCWLDLDGDGYEEPYIVTIEETSRKLLRIVSRWDRMEDVRKNARGQIIRIRPREYFTKYGFIPSPDGSVYDVGFGVLLGPLNEATNSLLNQLIDAGTMATTAGGFLGRGAKIRGGVYTFAPLEWKRVDSTGEDLKKSIFPLPVREPSNVLFQLLSLLINYTGKISGATDIILGDNPGQNTPAHTTQAMIEQGMKIYSAIFKRVWRSMKDEFKKLYVLNAIHMPGSVIFGEKGQTALREDFLGNPDRIAPVADPNVTSEAQRMAQAQALKQAAMTTPGYNIVEVERNYLRSMRVDGIDHYYPGPSKVPPLPNPKIQVEQLKLQAKQMQLQMQQQQFVMQLMEDKRVNDAKILELQSKAAMEMEQAGGIKTGHDIAAFEAAIGALKLHSAAVHERIKLITDQLKEVSQNDHRGNVEGVEAPSGDAGVPGGMPYSYPGAHGGLGQG